MLDVDNLKTLNDDKGHLAGDRAIKTVASSLRECIREVDKVFRYGGDEFVVVLTNTNYIGASEFSIRLLEHTKEKLSDFKSTKQVGISIGIATLLPSEEYHSLIDRADRALYAAKKSGKNCVNFY